MTRGRLMRDEEGAALVLALVFLSLFGVLTGAILTFADAGFRMTLVARTDADILYALDGAIEAAVNEIRDDPRRGADAPFYDCLDGYAPPPLNGVEIRVSCEPRNPCPTGAGRCTVAHTRPEAAVVALGTHPEEGIIQTSNDTVTIRGGVQSNSQLSTSAANARMVVEKGDVRAVGPCDPAKVSAPNGTVSCSDVTAALEDPAYPMAISAVPAPRTVPSCSGTGWLVTLEPGLYESAADLSELMDEACDKVVWFAPGAYYFDFRDHCPASPVTCHQWTVHNANMYVLGGECSDDDAPACGLDRRWDPSAARPTLSIPGTCRTEQTRATDGVYFIFGGDSRLNVESGRLEVCAPPTAFDQHIVVYGVREDSAAATTTTLSATTVTDPGGYTPPGSARVIDGDFARTTVPQRTTAAITIAGFVDPTAPGSRLENAYLRVRHGVGPRISAAAVEVLESGVPCATIALTTGPDHTDEPAPDLVAACNLQPADLPTLGLRYLATADNGPERDREASLDGMTLELSYGPPRFRRTTGCAVEGPYPSAGCALVKASGDQTIVLLQGTVYTPHAAIDLVCTHDGALSGRGIVARTVYFGVTPARRPCGGYQVAVPERLANDRRVYFRASVDDVEKLHVLATFHDDGGKSPGESIDVETWSLL